MNSIRTKLFALIMVIIISMFGVIALCQTTLLDDIYLHQKQKTIEQVQQEVIRSIQGTELSLSSSMVSHIIDQGLCISVYGSGFEVMRLDEMLGTQFSFSQFRYTMADRIHLENLNNPDTYSVQVKPDGNEDYSFLVIHDNIMRDGVRYSIVTSVSLVSMKEAQSILIEMLLWIFGGVIIAFTAITAVVARQVTSPLLRLTEAADMVRQGQFDVDLPAQSKDEIGQLERSFNQMAHDLSKIDALRRDLIANVSHDLRTPLTMIKGYAETIRDITGDNKQKREKQIAVIIQESDRLSALIGDVLALSKMQSGMLQLEKSVYDIGQQAQELMPPYEIYREQGYHIELDMQQCMVEADRKQIGQVILNLLNNAIKHTGEDKTVWLTGAICVDRPQVYRVEVRDTGKGIDPDEIPYIWDRYYKARNAKDKLMGTGIGLSIVKEILKAHGATYGVSSQIGKGTTFWFELSVKSCTQSVVAS